MNTTLSLPKDARLHAVLDALPVAAYTCDTDGLITYYNHEAARIWAREPRLRDPEERYSGALRMKTPAGAALTREQCWMAQALREGRPMSGGEMLVQRPDGSVRHVVMHARPLHDADGCLEGAINVLVDVTESRRTQEQAQRGQRLESIGMLAAGIAHDLNNILAPILLATPLLRPHLKESGDTRLLDTMERNAQRGAALVRQILDFAHGQAGERVVMQVRHLVRDMTTIVTETFPKSVVFEQRFGAALWPVRANPTQLHQVLLNLCVNARDAMPGGGTLRLVVENRTVPAGAEHRSGDYVCIEVSDSGTGVPLEIRDKIWEPFFTTKAEGRGTGLGLSTVRTIVEAHGGFVSLDSEPGSGSTFRVHLPAVPEKELVAIFR